MTATPGITSPLDNRLLDDVFRLLGSRRAVAGSRSGGSAVSVAGACVGHDSDHGLAPQRGHDMLQVVGECGLNLLQRGDHVAANEIVHIFQAPALCDHEVLDHLLIAMVRGRGAGDVEVGEPMCQRYRHIEAMRAGIPKNACCCAELKASEGGALAVVVQQVVCSQNLEQAPDPREWQGLRIQDHAGAPARLALQALVEGRLPPIAISQLRLDAVLVVAEEADPVREVLPILAHALSLALGVGLD
eukprot:CAMPEP_0177519558 /NCGR_PEP_ID=MMETSP0369-20130122/47169_1 /TAXON_ID=447022 ORGANISM="Scrippsiella hangoei-like, Strain SHHI-4" /NCGR_SAMPLE_ID=MMETSP0369 /ASSEMBLY_ACC=CAM_ASM_000364 /LENGTH=244 /DNA_ID=CAMNT_0018998833 /DNA_START=73 /DNA_END=806 /DNA_ORIENTATION=-